MGEGSGEIIRGKYANRKNPHISPFFEREGGFQVRPFFEGGETSWAKWLDQKYFGSRASVSKETKKKGRVLKPSP
jgi:hypothetical protein